MKTKYPVTWFKGMPIGPEVFQQNFLYTDETQRNIAQQSHKYGWGIKYLEISDISEGLLKIHKLSGLSKEFVPFEITQEDNVQINLSNFKDELKDKELFVFICVPNNSFCTQNNVTNPRYRTFTEEVVDLNNKDDSIFLEFLKENYTLEVKEKESLQNINIPIGKVKFNGVTYQFTEYAFPTQNIANSKLLLQQTENLVQIIKNKLKYLRSKKNNSIEYHFLSNNLSSILFPLERCVKCNVHPYEFYSTLVHAMGMMFASSEDKAIPMFEKYEHENHHESISAVLNYIKIQVNNIKEINVQRTFTKKDGMFGIEVEKLTKDIVIGLEKTANSTYQDMLNWIMGAIIGTQDKVETIREQRSQGAKRQIITNFEELNVKESKNLTMILVTLDNNYITENELLCLFNVNENLPTPSSIFLIER